MIISGQKVRTIIGDGTTITYLRGWSASAGWEPIWCIKLDNCVELGWFREEDIQIIE